MSRLFSIRYIVQFCTYKLITKFPFTEPQDGVKISLDCAQIAFIGADRIVLSLRGGELYVLTLCADSLRCVRSFHFSKAASSVLTCCVSSFFK